MVRGAVADLMMRHCGIVRAEVGMSEAQREIERLTAELRPPGREPSELEVFNLLTVASLMVRSALLREESRGVHLRSDCAERDDAHWLSARDAAPRRRHRCDGRAHQRQGGAGMSRPDAGRGAPGAAWAAADAVDAVGRALVRLALQEDLAGFGDVTSAWTVPAGAAASARVVAREEAAVSGLPLAAAVFAEVDPRVRFTPLVVEGAVVPPGGVLAEVTGPARSVLAAERVALNFLTHLCGVATQARRFAQAVAGTGATVVDTRKTTAGLRYWEKRAVRHGGCGNHRFGLFDLVLIKDNHLVAAGGVAAAVAAARAAAPFGMRVEVEVEDEERLREALAAGADIILLDNMTPAELRQSVAIARGLRGDVVLEASGGVTLATVRAIAEAGVDVISSGSLTSGAPPVDLGLDFA